MVVGWLPDRLDDYADRYLQGGGDGRRCGEQRFRPRRWRYRRVQHPDLPGSSIPGSGVGFLRQHLARTVRAQGRHADAHRPWRRRQPRACHAGAGVLPRVAGLRSAGAIRALPARRAQLRRIQPSNRPDGADRRLDEEAYLDRSSGLNRRNLTMPLNAGIFVKPTPDVGRNLQIVQELDEAGVDTVWQTNNVLWPDAMSFYAAAAATTERIRLGTSIMQIYPRHPAALVSQAQVIESLAPGRLRLGVGTSHRPRMEKNLGIKMGNKPLTYLREYVAVLRGLLWDGEIDLHGEFFNVMEAYPEGTVTPPKTEISISALSPKSYRMAGEIADAAIS